MHLKNIVEMAKTMIFRNFKELSRLKTFEERYEYLRIKGDVGIETFGFDRYLNQALYSSKEWKQVRDIVILRDNGCDLGMDGYEIQKGIIIHHMNPLTINDVLNRNEDIFNPNYLICCSHRTHNAIHYGDSEQLPKSLIERKPKDTCPWK